VRITRTTWHYDSTYGFGV